MGTKKKTQLEIIPAILEKRLAGIQSQLGRVSSLAKWAQIDVGDGKFVPERTFLGLRRLSELRTGLSLDVHLMVSDPKKHILALAKAKKVRRITVHVESFPRHLDLLEAISLIREGGREVALALNPGTALAKALPWTGLVNEVLFLTVNPGRQGNPFRKAVLAKAKALRQGRNDVIIALDGGIAAKNIRACRLAGATRFCVGSFLLKDGDPRAKLRELRAAL